MLAFGCAVAGFTHADASGELRRSVQTLRLSAEGARRLAGDGVPLEGAPQQEDAGTFLYWIRKKAD